MNSCLYEGVVMHKRFKPREYAFSHKVFMFYLDLDEIEELAARLKLLSRNRFNVYDFRDADHLRLSHSGVKENILEYLKTKQNANLSGGKIMMLTNLRTFGYVFNPVSFYFCSDAQARPAGMLAEVGNTFGELKPYWLGRECFLGGEYKARQVKHYYISPFMDLDLSLDFGVKVPGERLFVKVDDIDRSGERIFISTLTGTRKPLSDKTLLESAVRFPLITLQVISMIHWHALVLWLKKVPHRRKEDHPELQKDVYREHAGR